jgi:hypothetical protein
MVLDPEGNGSTNPGVSTRRTSLASATRTAGFPSLVNQNGNTT